MANQTIQDILEFFREEARNNRDLGDRFERLIAAYDYVVNGKPAIEWIMNRYQFSEDKDSQIVNDPNDWAREHDDLKYILNLLKSIIAVSVETMKIVNALPS
jgi:predicted helicase